MTSFNAYSVYYNHVDYNKDTTIDRFVKWVNKLFKC